jgi:uncharacterized protein YndB with AHSA1/START domain
MLDPSQLIKPADAPEIIVSRLIDAPRDLVFDSFRAPGPLANWWGPTGFTLTTHEMTFAQGGVWRFVMHGPDGRDYNNKIVFRDIIRPERISYIHPGDEGAEPVRMQVTVTFDVEDGKVRLTLLQRFETIAERDHVDREYGAAEGAKQTLARLDDYVVELGKRAFAVSRSFDASRALLWKALTEPDRMAKWWGPKGFPVAEAKMDFRPGGRYLYGLKTPDGGAMWGRFIYREIDEPSRITLISSFSDENGGVTRHPMSSSWPLEMLSIFDLETEGERTRLTVRWLPINATDEEYATFLAAIDGMKQGWSGTLDQLGDYLASE